MANNCKEKVKVLFYVMQCISAIGICHREGIVLKRENYVDIRAF